MNPFKKFSIKTKTNNTTRTEMDEPNKKALDVLVEKGEKEFIKHVFTGEKGKKLTYAQMRDRYG